MRDNNNISDNAAVSSFRAGGATAFITRGFNQESTQVAAQLHQAQNIIVARSMEAFRVMEGLTASAQTYSHSL